MRWIRTVGGLLCGLFIGGVASCTPTVNTGACDGVSGSCLDLFLEGTGPYSVLEVTLGLGGGLSPQIIRAEKSLSLPYHFRVVPPSETRTSDINSLRIRAKGQTIDEASLDGLYWPNNSHVSYSLRLHAGTSPALPFSTQSRHFTLSTLAVDIITGDFNKDGLPDVAALCLDGSVTISLGDRNAYLSAPYQISSDKGTADLAVGDINNDGWLDLLISNFTNANIKSLINMKNGKFLPQTPLSPIVQFFPNYTELGDFNQDGKLDVCYGLTANSGESKIHYRYGDGTGGFGSEMGINTTPINPGYMHVADMNKDGMLDIIASSAVDNGGLDSNRLFVLMNVGNGFFPSKADIRSNSLRPMQITIADINQDKFNDIVNIDAKSADGKNALGVLINSGDGISYKEQSYDTGPKPQRIISSDIDMDGIKELLITNAGDDSVLIYFPDQIGNISRKERITVGGFPTCLATIDLNQDKRPDLIVCSGNGIDVFLNTTL